MHIQSQMNEIKISSIDHLSGVKNVQATDWRRRYGRDGAQPCAQH